QSDQERMVQEMRDDRMHSTAIEERVIRLYFETRLGGIYRALPTIALAGFISGTALTTALIKRWPDAGLMMLVAATSAAFANAVMNYLRVRKSRAEYEKSLAELRAMNPELADLMEANLNEGARKIRE